MKTTMETTTAGELEGMPHWRLKGIGLLRILFGIVWGVDAWFKWQPGFINGFSGYLSGAQDGQPLLLHHWIVFWTNTVGIDPTLFAYTTAVAETAIAIALIVGAFTNLTFVVGIVLSVAIWTTAEGFGGPYGAGSTDIGAAIIYPLVFTGLFLSSAGLYYGVDRRLTAALGRFGYLATGGFHRAPSKAPIGTPIPTF
ncbi:MAG TPA: hypothetical protein VGS16_08865 [Candidatus Dormibacteraeota bacterium]|nr:hypothetical protein [Candidatus Dormibacteraeota bacterium]